MTTYLKTNQLERRRALANAKGVALDKIKEISSPYFEVNDKLPDGRAYQHDGGYIIAMTHEIPDLMDDALEAEFKHARSEDPTLTDDADSFCEWSERQRSGRLTDDIASILAPNYDNHSIELIKSEDGTLNTYHVLQTE